MNRYRRYARPHRNNDVQLDGRIFFTLFRSPGASVSKATFAPRAEPRNS
jgi:hypothetical protein